MPVIDARLSGPSSPLPRNASPPFVSSIGNLSVNGAAGAIGLDREIPIGMTIAAFPRRACPLSSAILFHQGDL